MPQRVSRKFAVRVASLLIAITLAVAASASGPRADSVSHANAVSPVKAAATAQLAMGLSDVPEPASVGLLALGALMVVGRRKHVSAA